MAEKVGVSASVEEFHATLLALRRHEAKVEMQNRGVNAYYCLLLVAIGSNAGLTASELARLTGIEDDEVQAMCSNFANGRVRLRGAARQFTQEEPLVRFIGSNPFEEDATFILTEAGKKRVAEINKND